MCRILVIDDEPDTVIIFDHLSFLQSWAIRNALDAKTALARLREEPPFDVILLDISLPDMDGLVLLEKIRAVDPYVAVCMVTAHTDFTNVQAAMYKGAAGFLQKPYTLEHLKMTVKQMSLWTEFHRHAAQAVQSARKELETAIRVITHATKIKSSILREYTHSNE